MNTILVPLDGSARAEQILPCARQLALILKARLYLLRVVPELRKDDRYAMMVAETYRMAPGSSAIHRQRAWRSQETQRRHAEGYLESLAVMMQSEGIQVDFEVRLGHPAEQIVAVAEEQRAALLAMATHGYSGLKRWARGSVTDKVAHATTAPVLIIHSGEQQHGDQVAFNRILVPLDGSDFAAQALPLAIELASGAKAKLTLLRAVRPAIETSAGFPPPGRPDPQLGAVLAAMRARAGKELVELAGDLDQDLPVTTVVANGQAAEVIVDEANQRHDDLIVMATHGYTGIKRWARGSVAEKVLHAVAVPLLLVHAGSAQLPGN